MTSTAFLSNPVPGNGDVSSNSPFSFQSSIGIKRDYGALPTVNALQNPSLHNRVPDVMVNSTARAPIFVRPFTREFEKRYSEGDLLFVQKDDRMSAGQKQNVVFNLPVLNYMLKTHKASGSDVLKYATRMTIVDGRNVIDYDGLYNIVKDINYFGILNNDMDTGSKWQRLLNVNVRGRSRVARLWSKPTNQGRLKRGDIVYIGFFPVAIKPGAEDAQTGFDPNGNRFVYTGSTATSTLYEARAVMECSPGINNALGINNAEYIIPIGIVSQVSMKSPSINSVDKAHFVSEASNSLERIEVLMRI